MNNDRKSFHGNSVKLSDEEIDAVCSALAEQVSAREATGLELDLQLAGVFEAIRKKIRGQFPLTSALKKLASEVPSEPF